MPESSETDEELLTQQEASDILGVHYSTLNKWRKRNHGPPYYEYDSGSVRYPESELRDWMQNCRRVPSEEAS